MRNKTIVMICAALGCVVIGAVFFFFLQYSAAGSLSKDLAQKSGQLEEMQRMRSRIELLKKDNRSAAMSQSDLNLIIPVNEPQQMQLYKVLLQAGRSFGLRDLTIENAAAVVSSGPGASGAPAEPAENLPEGIKSIRFVVSFDGLYSDSLLFLRKVYQLPRLTSVERISIDRIESKLPFQHVSMSFVTYTDTQ